MARFDLILPDEILKDLRKIYDNSDEIFGAMTRAGAEVVQRNVAATCPVPDMASHVALSRTYKTPTDGGINTKVYFKGYLAFKGNRKYFVRRNRAGGKVYRTDKGVPAAFLAQMFEYGRSSPDFPKKPFFRKAFKGDQITSAMLKKQKEASNGILD